MRSVVKTSEGTHNTMCRLCIALGQWQ
jgi:hypothetical protein